MRLIIHSDGGARGNPGPAGVGVVVREEDQEKMRILHEASRYIGETTNNVAEYQAIIDGLAWLQEHQEKIRSHIREVVWHIDSQLVVNQLNGLFKVKDQKMRALFTDIRIREQSLPWPIVYKQVPREENSAADALVNHALDSHL